MSGEWGVVYQLDEILGSPRATHEIGSDEMAASNIESCRNSAALRPVVRPVLNKDSAESVPFPETHVHVQKDPLELEFNAVLPVSQDVIAQVWYHLLEQMVE